MLLWDSQARREQVQDQSHRKNCFGFRRGPSGGHGMPVATPLLKRVSSVEVASDWVTAASDGEVGDLLLRQAANLVLFIKGLIFMIAFSGNFPQKVCSLGKGY